jgi:putative transposase
VVGGRELVVSEEMTPIVEPSADEQLAKELVERARSEGVQLVGPGGLLGDLTKTVLETALEVEMEDHLGYAKRRRAATEATRETAAGRRRF